MSKKIKGYAHKLGDHVNTDEIIPACYLNASEDSHLARYCLAGIRPGYAEKFRPGDVLVAGENFGCGSSREHAPRAIKAAGLSCVVAKSFARIFFRNAINIGLPIVECPRGAGRIKDGDLIGVDLARGKIHNLTRKEEYGFSAFPDFLENIISRGSLMKTIT